MPGQGLALQTEFKDWDYMCGVTGLWAYSFRDFGGGICCIYPSPGPSRAG
jgi:hypothetical protein